jgi:hypothetical protein
MSMPNNIQIEIPVTHDEYNLLFNYMEPVRVTVLTKMGNYFRYRVDCVLSESETVVSAVISARIRGIFEIHPALNPPKLSRNFFQNMIKYNPNPGEFIPVLKEGKLLVDVILPSSLIINT